jgi:quercetin dioxygenase-like cupin family protein
MCPDAPGTLTGGAVTPAADLVAHQDGGVVSRVVLKQGSGTVTAFAFDAGQELSEHTAPFDALVHLVEGELAITLAGAERRLATGELLLMPAHVPHALRAVSRCKLLLTMIRLSPT